MKQITFIHAADLHLDSPMVGLMHLPAEIYGKVRESTFQALKGIIAEAINLSVDFVIFAGDLFDGEDRSIRAQSRLRTEMMKLEEKGIPVYVIHGNHDHLGGTWVNLEMPPNVHVFNKDIETKFLKTKTGETVHLYGFSYPVRHVFERKIDEYKKVSGADFHIGILHGNESSGTDHDNYAPFHVKDLLEKHYDYWALGHIHKRSVLSETPPIIYPGNIQGRNRKELGVKGCYHVTLTDRGANLSFIETSDIVWEEAVVDTSSAGNFHDVYLLCQNVIQQYRNLYKGTLLSLHLENIQINDPEEKKALNSELLELLREEEAEEESFVWIVQLDISEGVKLNKEQLKMEANFYGELFSSAEQFKEAEETVSPLYDHHHGRKYLSGVSPAEQQELIRQAEMLLIKLLHQS